MGTSARLLLTSMTVGVLFAVITFLTLEGMSTASEGRWYSTVMLGHQRNFKSSINANSSSYIKNNTTQQLQDLLQLSHMQNQQLQKAHQQFHEAQKQLQKAQQLQKTQQQLHETQRLLQEAQELLQEAQEQVQEEQQLLQEAQQKLQSRQTVQEVQPQKQKKVRVLVWVLTEPTSHVKKAVHVRDTWGKRVDKLLFMSTADDQTLPTVNLHVKKGNTFLWEQTRAAFRHVYKNHLQEADWFMKADDDTFVVVENLRYMLSLYNPATPIYFGSRFKNHSKEGIMSGGGGGYVLSKAALKLFVEKALDNTTLCKPEPTGSNEDVQIGKCLYSLGVIAGDSRDDLGRGRLFPFQPAQHLVSGFIETQKWYRDNIYYPMQVGPECCSDTAISFHYVGSDKMQELEYLLYHLRPHGLYSHDSEPPKLPPDHKSVPKEILDRYLNGTSK